MCPQFSDQFKSAKELAQDVFASFGAQTGKYFSHLFGDKGLPFMSGEDIARYWEDSMSPQGKARYENNPLYQEATDPLNYVLGGAAKKVQGLSGASKVVKGIGFAADPIGEAATTAAKSYGRVINSNAAARAAAKRKFR